MSIVEVAKIAGVSHCTVSRVINGSHKVSGDTVQIVREAMQKLGYAPPPPNQRRGPKTTASKPITAGNCVAVIMITKNSSYMLSGNSTILLKGIDKGLKEQGLNMLLSFVSPDEIPNSLNDRSVIGAIVILGEPKGELRAKLKMIPTLAISSRHTEFGNIVMTGSDIVGRIAATYLINKGHTELAFLNPLGNHPGYSSRGEGFFYVAFQQNCTVHKFIDTSLSFDEILELSLEKGENKITILMDKLLNLPKLPTGLFIPSDRMTAMAYRYLNKRNIVPGKDIAIISADYDASFLAGLNPRPVTIDIQHFSMGLHAVKDLLWKIRNPGEISRVQTVLDPLVIEPENF